MKNIFITEGDPTGISYEIFDETLDILKRKSKQFRFILISSQNEISSKAEKEFLSINSRTSIEPALKDKASSKITSFKNTILSKKEEKELKTLEKEIENLEKEKAKIQEDLITFHSDFKKVETLSAKLLETDAIIEVKFKRWEELGE